MRDDPSVLDGLLDVSRETRVRLESFEALLRRWQRKTNLVGSDTLDTFWQHHVGDAAFLYRYGRNVTHWTDIGAGAGLPGLVLAILAQDDGRTVRIDLVESNAKKCAFQRAAVLEVGLRGGSVDIGIHAVRIEDHDAGRSVATARALAPLPDLLGYLRKTGATRGLFLKGERHEEEVAAARRHGSFDVTIVPHPLRPGSALLDVAL